LQLAYTYSKTYDTSTGVAVNGNEGDLDTLSNPYNRQYDWGLSTYARPNVFLADYVWNGSCPKSVISVRRVVASDRSSDRLLR